MPAVLESERLRLRPLSDEDVAAFAEWYADPEVMRYIGSGRTFEPHEIPDVVARMRRRFETDGIGQFAVVEKATGEVVGRAGLLVWDAVEWRATTRTEATGPIEVELGWMLGRRHWGNGYATEAARTVRDRAHAEGIARLISLIDPDNARSIRVAERIGARFERELVTGYGNRVLVYVTERAGTEPR